MEPLLIGVSRSSPYMIPRESVAKSLSMCARDILSLRVIPWENLSIPIYGVRGVDNLLSRAFTRIAKASRGPRFYSPVYLCVLGVFCPWFSTFGHGARGAWSLPAKASREPTWRPCREMQENR